MGRPANPREPVMTREEKLTTLLSMAERGDATHPLFIGLLKLCVEQEKDIERLNAAARSLQKLDDRVSFTQSTLNELHHRVDSISTRIAVNGMPSTV